MKSIKAGIIQKAMAGVFIIGAAISSSCDTARDLVPDNTPIERSGNTNFEIVVKPIGDDGYETTIRLTDLIIYDGDGNQLSGVTIEDIIIGKTDTQPVADNPNGDWDWLSDLIEKEPGYQGLDCDTQWTFAQSRSTGKADDFHEHWFNYLHTHEYWSHSHYHERGKKIERVNNPLDRVAKDEHSHQMHLNHSHPHKKWTGPPEIFHVHECK